MSPTWTGWASTSRRSRSRSTSTTTGRTRAGRQGRPDHQRGVRRVHRPLPRPVPAAGHRAAAGHRCGHPGAALSRQELGMRGIEIGTHVEGEEISSPRLEPFWAEVEALGLVVVIHTQGATHPQRLARPQLRQHRRPCLRGHPRHRASDLQRRRRAPPGAQDPGGARRRLPAGLRGAARPRLAGSGGHARGRPAAARPTYLRKFFFDTMVFEPGQLKYLVDTLRRRPRAARHRLPLRHGRRRPAGALGRHRGLDQEQVDLIAGGNAARLLGLA